MRLQTELWTRRLISRSAFARYPIMVLLIPYLLGSIAWRLSQVQWDWYERDLQMLPMLVGLGLAMLLIFRHYWWRFWLVLKNRHFYLLLMVFLCLVGYYYSAYQWQKTEFPHFLHNAQIQVDGRIVEIAGKDSPETLVVKILHTSTGINLTGQLEVIRPELGQDVKIVSTARALGQPPTLQIGDRVILLGTLQEYKRATNPGQFDYQRYQRYRGFRGQMFAPKVYFRERPAFSLLRWLNAGKNHAEKFFARLSPANRPLVLALLTGDTDSLGDDALAAVRNLGLSHLLAVSGLHLALVAVWIGKILKWCKVPQQYCPWILSLCVWLAVLFVGSTPSALRAGIFIMLLEFAKIFNRKAVALNLLALTGIFILVFNPLVLFLLSFQLSFVVYLAILLLYQPILHGLKRFLPQWTKLAESLALSLAAFFGSAPVVLFSFYQLSLQGILMNLWAVPLSGLILGLILLSLVIGTIFPFAGGILLSFLDMLVTGFNYLTDFFNTAFSSVWEPGRPLVIWIAVYCVACLVVGRLVERSQQKMPRCWYQQEWVSGRNFFILVILLIGLVFCWPEQTEFEWVMLDVGQGDGMFLELPQGFRMLIDGGGKPGGENYVGEKIVKPFLLSRGVKELDLVWITHFDADHVRGLLPVLENFQVNAIWAPAGSESEYAFMVQEIAKERHIPIFHPAAGQIFSIAGARFHILHPEKDGIYAKENDRSISFRLEFGGRTLLFTGDLGEKEEAKLVQSGVPLQADFLKVGHHGSKTSSSEVFVQQVRPAFSFISVGPNRYGHPTQETLSRLAAAGSKVWRTDELGALMVRMDEGRVKMQYYNNNRQKI